MKKQTTRTIRNHKIASGKSPLNMLTCYDFQTAQMFNETEIDLLLVGDSVGNVILGYDTTIPVTINEMSLFGAAVTRGAPDKFITVDMPFGSYASMELGINNALKLFQNSLCQALKVEGASQATLTLMTALVETGIPMMGHLGLTPQSVHQLGGYYTHGKDQKAADQLMEQALLLQEAGAFAIVLECVWPEVADKITAKLSIPTIGIGSGQKTDGQVLVVNDLFHLGKNRPPKFCTPIANLFETKKDLIDLYCKQVKKIGVEDAKPLHH